jgi:hypothetical protein
MNEETTGASSTASGETKQPFTGRSGSDEKHRPPGSTRDGDGTHETADNNKVPRDQENGKTKTFNNWQGYSMSQIEKPDVLISGILQRGHLMALGSVSKAGKTWILLELGVSLATGGKWLGIHQCTPCKVLYVNFEILAYNFRERIKIVCAHLGVDTKDEKLGTNLLVGNFKGNVPSYEDFQQMLHDELSASGLGEQRFDCIIIDPWYRMANGRDENAAGDVGDILNKFETIAKEYQLTVVYAAHFAKGRSHNKAAIDRISGSGVHGRAPDAIVTFSPMEDNPDYYAVEYILRDFVPKSAHTMRWNCETCRFEHEPDVKPEVQNPAHRPQEFSVEELVDLLEIGGSTTRQWEEAAKDCGWKRSTFFIYQAEARARGLVRKVGRLWMRADPKK